MSDLVFKKAVSPSKTETLSLEEVIIKNADKVCSFAKLSASISFEAKNDLKKQIAGFADLREKYGWLLHALDGNIKSLYSSYNASKQYRDDLLAQIKKDNLEANKMGMEVSAASESFGIGKILGQTLLELNTNKDALPSEQYKQTEKLYGCVYSLQSQFLSAIPRK